MDLMRKARHAAFALAVELLLLLPGIEAEVEEMRIEAAHWLTSETPWLSPDCEADTRVPGRAELTFTALNLVAPEMATLLCGPETAVFATATEERTR